ncbi:hypothetical protein CsSME_00048915 [Camellia sinensis var. sinensis]
MRVEDITKKKKAKKKMKSTHRNSLRRRHRRPSKGMDGSPSPLYCCVAFCCYVAQDDGYGGKTVKDYLDNAKEIIKPDGGPPRWFCPVECGCPLKDSSVLLFLPAPSHPIPPNVFFLFFGQTLPMFKVIYSSIKFSDWNIQNLALSYLVATSKIHATVGKPS